LLALIPANFILSSIEEAQSAHQATSNLISDIQGPYVETTKDNPIDSLASDSPISKAVESSVETTKDIQIDSLASDIPILKAVEAGVETAKGISLLFLASSAVLSVGAMFMLGIILVGIFRLIIPLLSLPVMVRRLHDTGRSGWACLIGLVPLIGGLILFMWLCEDSNLGMNEYGKNPKGL
jgi:uncharacterized membrane protein YhaH (DUF805 family)